MFSSLDESHHQFSQAFVQRTKLSKEDQGAAVSASSPCMARSWYHLSDSIRHERPSPPLPGAQITEFHQLHGPQRFPTRGLKPFGAAVHHHTCSVLPGVKQSFLEIHTSKWPFVAEKILSHCLQAAKALHAVTALSSPLASPAGQGLLHAAAVGLVWEQDAPVPSPHAFPTPALQNWLICHEVRVNVMASVISRSSARADDEGVNNNIFYLYCTFKTENEISVQFTGMLGRDNPPSHPWMAPWPWGCHGRGDIVAGAPLRE